jgi:hypothetical protein
VAAGATLAPGPAADGASDAGPTQEYQP